MAYPEYIETMLQAITVYNQRQFREAADIYWKSFRQATAVDKWAEYRYFILTEYVRMLLGQHFRACDQDLKSLTKLLEDQQEEKLYRIEAGQAVGDLYCERDDWETSAHSYRLAIALADSATPTELKMTVIMDQQKDYTVKQLITAHRTKCAHLLGILDTPLDPTNPMFKSLQFRSDDSVAAAGSSYPSENFVSTQRRLVGGSECDFCLKTLAELGVTMLNCCSACKLAYYCSQTCQRAAWKAGHKEACRKPDERRVGDVMRLVDLVSRPELNGRSVILVSPEPNDRWQVHIHSHTPVPNISVSTKKLRHFRPQK